MENNPEAIKLLICGDVVGNFKLLAKKISSLNTKKGPFKFCLCVGQFFDSNNETNEILNTTENADLFASTPIYVFEEKPSDFQLKNSEHITIVGSNSGIIQTVEGFRIVFVLKSNRKEIEKLIDVVTRDKIDVKGVDFLISEWPFGIIDETDESYTDENTKPEGQKLLSYLAHKIKPRYHFAGRENVHYQRSAYKNIKMGPHDHKPIVLTRFVALGRVPDKKITKSFHALSILPINKMSLAETLELQKCSFVGKNPYLALNFDEFSSGSGSGSVVGGTVVGGTVAGGTVAGSLKSKTFHDQDQDQEPLPQSSSASSSSAAVTTTATTTSSTITAASATPSSSSSSSSSSSALSSSSLSFLSHYSSGQQNVKKLKSDHPSECWFCIGNEKVEKHYILHMKEHMYLTRAKGGITYEHMIITSLQHYKSTLDLPDFVIADLQSYKNTLALYYQSKGYVVVFYERNFRSSHIQIHAIPVPTHKANSLLPVFHKLCKENNLYPMKISTLETTRSTYPKNLLYFYIELPNNKFIIHNLPNNFKIFFGRLILGHPNVLNKPDRINWRTCVYDMSQELRYTNLMKTLLKNYL